MNKQKYSHTPSKTKLEVSTFNFYSIWQGKKENGKELRLNLASWLTPTEQQEVIWQCVKC